MKLLRLTSNDPLAVFNNDLHDELILKPNSKIGLQNLTMDTTGEAITIDNQNNKVFFSITPSIQEEILLPQGTYDKSNFTSLNQALQDGLNSMMAWIYDNSRRYLGTEWTVTLNSSGKLVVSMKYADIYGAELLSLTNNVEVQNGVLRWKDFTPVGVNVNTHYLYSNYFCSRGQGYIRCKTFKMEDNGSGLNQTNGYILGLMSIDPTTYKGGEIPMEDIDYAIWVGHPDGNYRYFVSGVQNNTTETLTYNSQGDADNDSQEVCINGNTIEINYYSQASNNFKEPVTLFQADYDGTTKYYPVCILRGGYDYARASNIRFTLSPENTTTTAGIEPEDNNLTGTPPQQNKTPQVCYLNFQSVNVANYFGFKNENNPQFPNSYVVSEPEFTADEKFDPREIGDSYLIEMLNMKLESYDGFVNQRKNILAVIPKSNNDNGLVQYVPPYLSMIELNNPKEISLRNIKCRIIKNDYTPVNLFGLSTITVIFD